MNSTSSTYERSCCCIAISCWFSIHYSMKSSCSMNCSMTCCTSCCTSYMRSSMTCMSIYSCCCDMMSSCMSTCFPMRSCDTYSMMTCSSCMMSILFHSKNWWSKWIYTKTITKTRRSMNKNWWIEAKTKRSWWKICKLNDDTCWIYFSFWGSKKSDDC